MRLCTTCSDKGTHDSVPPGSRLFYRLIRKFQELDADADKVG